MGLLAIFRKQAIRRPALPAGARPVRSAGELLSPLQAQIEEVQRLVAIPKAHWSRLYAPLLDGYASLVQDLPLFDTDREEGHDRLLTRGIEAVILVLKLRRSTLLPAGAGAEAIAREQDLWTFAAATSALLRTLIPSLAQQLVTLYDPHGHALGPWVPWTSPIGRSGAAWYVAQRQDRSPDALHRRAAPLLARMVLPEQGIRWLGSHLDVFAAWLAAIVDEREAAGALGELLDRVEAALVSEVLSRTERRAGEPAPTRSPPDRLLSALRRLLDEGEIPLNDERASGWVVGEALWLAADRALGALRDALSVSAERNGAHSDQDLLDALREDGLLVLNAGAPLWTAEVRGEGWARPREESLLCLSVPQIWPSLTRRPIAFAGSVTPIRAARRVEGDPARSAERSTPSDDTDMPRGKENAAAHHPGLAPPSPGIPRPGRADAPPPADAGRLFLNWLREGLANGELPMNEPAARVHVIPEGLLLVSPALFQDFDRVGWSEVQKRFQKLKLHRKGEQGVNIRTYQSEAPGAPGEVIQGLLIPEPREVFPGVIFPPANPRLRLTR